MKKIRCLLGMHSYSLASAEVKVVDERSGYLICRVHNCCVYCGKAIEDIIPIPFPEWLSRKEKESETFHIGDEVIDRNGCKFVVTDINNKSLHGLTKGGFEVCYMMEYCNKTGKNYPWIAEIMKELDE